MERPTTFFHKKIIKKQTTSAEQRKAKHKKSTKAELKKEFINHCQKVIEHLEVFNRISMANEKVNHLNIAITHLNKSLSYKPGNHLLRNQIKLCRNKLTTLKESDKCSANNSVEILFDTDLF